MFNFTVLIPFSWAISASVLCIQASKWINNILQKYWFNDNKIDCEHSRRPFRRKMSSLGRFSLRSETAENPSIMSFFLLLDGADVELEEFNTLLQQRLLDKYERFNARICPKISSSFEILERTVDHFSSKVDHPNNAKELHDRIKHMLLSPLVSEGKLWEANISSGDFGSCGAFPSLKPVLSGERRETLVLFRVHHSICDGVSMSSVLGDLTDECKSLRLLAQVEMEKTKTMSISSVWNNAIWLCKLILYYLVGSLWALALQGWRMVFSINPFDSILKKHPSRSGHRSLSWRYLGSIEEMKSVAKAISQGATLNDLSVALVSVAIRKQLESHHRNEKTELPDYVNVVIPVHMDRGIVLPGNDIGNRIGAFVTSIPIVGSNSRTRVLAISKKLKEGKRTPAPWIAWLIAKFLSDYTPESFAKLAMVKANAQAVAVISNIRGFPMKVHWLCRSVEALCAFLPLPPSIPIGVMIMSYHGDVSFSINADSRAVPDADLFADWMIEEYRKLKELCGLHLS